MSTGPIDYPTNGLVEHFFRHEAGRITATLVRRFGVHRLDDIEDSVQYAFERALGRWPRRGVPDVPAAWLRQVARNRLIDRTRQLRSEALLDLGEESRRDGEVRSSEGEDLLTLLFACANNRLMPRARLILCLKLVCGFSIKEISLRLFMSSANIQKTLERGRQRLRESYLNVVSAGSYPERVRAKLDTVQHVLYLIFNEGYSLGAGETGLRVELCDEAIRLTGLLVQHEVGNLSSTWALLALMHFHAMRLPTRLDADGRFVPLASQDRSQWDPHHRQLAFTCMQEAVRDQEFSRFHGEAAIQVEHALAPSMEDTRWVEIVALYATLERMTSSPMYTLNRAIAQAEATGPQDGLDLLDQALLPKWFRDHHLFQAAVGELYRRLGHNDQAAQYLEQAMMTVPSIAERQYFEAQLKEVRG
ncbi:MAG: sigma-70 family RNA polymerase sigma factor [Myxococcales bacterium]|nr:sigma-70 family RNA polymerase sigma factor [Myxococcales bacterium]